jgi:hypothetical protein
MNRLAIFQRDDPQDATAKLINDTQCRMRPSGCTSRRSGWSLTRSQ